MQYKTPLEKSPNIHMHRIEHRYEPRLKLTMVLQQIKLQHGVLEEDGQLSQMLLNMLVPLNTVKDMLLRTTDPTTRPQSHVS